MTANEESGSQKWSASVFMQTPEDVSRDFTAVATAVSSPRPSVVFPLVDDGSNSQLQRLRHQVSKMLKGYSHPPQTRRITYNPEVLTSQKRQWARVHLQSLDHRSFKEPSRLFESMVVVGLHPDCDIQALRRHVLDSKYEGSGKFRSAISGQNHSRVGPSLEPQVLFVYPPEKQLPLQYKDILSFCIPHGVEVRAVERTPSMSELNEILLGQEYLKQSALSFIFRLQAADNATLYGCCILVEELANKPSRLISMISDSQPFSSCLGRSTLATKRCYCILSRLPYFELHFGVLNSILTEERLERLRNSIGALNLDMLDADSKVEAIEDKCISPKYVSEDRLTESVKTSQSTDITIENVADGDNPVAKGFFSPCQSDGCDFLFSKSAHRISEKDFSAAVKDPEGLDTDCNGIKMSKQTVEKCIPDAVLPLLHYKQYESSESSSSFQGSPAEDRHFRSDNDEADTEETSFSGQEDFSGHNDILDWARENHHGSLQIICEYYRLSCPQRGSTIIFQPLEHLQPLEFQRPDEKVLNIAGSSLDLRSCSTSFEIAEVHSALMAEEEATALSAWAISSLCGNLRLENVLTMFAAALLEKQIAIVCSNLGTLSASVLSIIPLIRPYRWQSLLMPILPNDMLDFLDAPVPYIVGIKSKASEVQSKLANVVLVDLDRNQVRSPSVPHLPRLKELMASLSPYHSKLVGESYLGKRRPVYDCTDVQVEAASGFLDVLRSYLDSLCYNLRSHTITNVQSNDDKVSLLLKESFIDSFPGRYRPFMKLFVDTQMFSVRTDLVLSFYQKE